MNSEDNQANDFQFVKYLRYDPNALETTTILLEQKIRSKRIVQKIFNFKNEQLCSFCFAYLKKFILPLKQQIILPELQEEICASAPHFLLQDEYLLQYEKLDPMVIAFVNDQFALYHSLVTYENLFLYDPCTICIEQEYLGPSILPTIVNNNNNNNNTEQSHNSGSNASRKNHHVSQHSSSTQFPQPIQIQPQPQQQQQFSYKYPDSTWRNLDDFLEESRQHFYKTHHTNTPFQFPLVSQQWILNVFSQLCRILLFLHSQYIYLGELLHEKNLFVDKQGRLKIGDYGCTELYHFLPTNTTSSQSSRKKRSTVQEKMSLNIVQSKLQHAQKKKKFILKTQLLQTFAEKNHKYDLFRMGLILLKILYQSTNHSAEYCGTMNSSLIADGNYSLPAFFDTKQFGATSQQTDFLLQKFVRKIPQDVYPMDLLLALQELIGPSDEKRPLEMEILNLPFLKQFLSKNQMQWMDTIWHQNNKQIILVKPNQSIQKVMQQLPTLKSHSQPPFILLLQKGTYRENLFIEQPIQLIAKEKVILEGNITIRAHPKLSHISKSHTIQTTQQLFLQQQHYQHVNHVVIQNICILHHTSKEEEEAAITIQHWNVSILDCEIVSQFGHGVKVCQGEWYQCWIQQCHVHSCGKSGIFITSKSKGLFTKMEVFDNQIHGFDIRSESNPLIHQNRIFGNKNCGIMISEKSFGKIIQNQIQSNAVHGILVLTLSKPLLLRNQVSKNQQSGIQLFNHGFGWIQHNLIQQNQHCGVKISELSHVTLQQNCICENRMNGIEFTERSQGNCFKNQITQNQQNGIVVNNFSDPHIYQNQINQNTNHGIVIQHKSTTGIYKQNNISHNKGYGIVCKLSCEPWIKRNQIFANDWGGILMELKAKVVLERNHIFDHSVTQQDRAAVLIRNQKTDAVCKGNSIEKNAMNGVIVFNFALCSMEDNQIKGNLLDQLRAYDFSKVKLEKNNCMAFSKQGRGVHCFANAKVNGLGEQNNVSENNCHEDYLESLEMQDQHFKFTSFIINRQ